MDRRDRRYRRYRRYRRDRAVVVVFGPAARIEVSAGVMTLVCRGALACSARGFSLFRRSRVCEPT